MSARAATWHGVLLHLAGGLLALGLLRAAWLADRAEHDRVGTELKELEEVHGKLANHDALATQLAALRPMLQSLAQRLPDRIDGAAMEQGLRADAEKHGVSMASLAWSTEYVHEGFYADRTATVVLRGAPGDFAAFVQDLLGQVPAPQVTALQLRPGDASHTLRATLRVAYFRLLADVP